METRRRRWMAEPIGVCLGEEDALSMAAGRGSGCPCSSTRTCHAGPSVFKIVESVLAV